MRARLLVSMFLGGESLIVREVADDRAALHLSMESAGITGTEGHALQSPRSRLDELRARGISRRLSSSDESECAEACD